MLEGAQRQKFVENQGRFYAGTGYYRDADIGFAALQNFKPLQKLEFDKIKDFCDFKRGFEEVQELRILVMLIKRKAQAENSYILKELEGKGISFLMEGVKVEDE